MQRVAERLGHALGCGWVVDALLVLADGAVLCIRNTTKHTIYPISTKDGGNSEECPVTADISR